MQILVNKKNINRIQRRTPKQVRSQHSEFEPFSTISTFRTINPQKNKILKIQTINDKISFKIDSFFSFCKNIKIKKDPFDELSKPKAASCHKLLHHRASCAVKQTKRSENYYKRNQHSNFNKTISFSLNQTVKTTRHSIPKILTGQEEIDLKNQQFKRRHKSFRAYENLSIQQTQKIQKNTIMSNNLNNFSITQIYEMKKMQDERKKLINQILRTGQLTSNEPGLSEQLRQIQSQNSQLETLQSDKFAQTPKINDIFDKKTVEKYQKLLDQLNSTQKYVIQNYEDYQKTLLQRNSLYKRRKANNKNKILANFAQEWR